MLLNLPKVKSLHHHLHCQEREIHQKIISKVQIPRLIKNKNELYFWQCGSGHVVYIDNIVWQCGSGHVLYIDNIVWQWIYIYDCVIWIYVSLWSLFVQMFRMNIPI
jgi:hypothetical protein